MCIDSYAMSSLIFPEKYLKKKRTEMSSAAALIST